MITFFVLHVPQHRYLEFDGHVTNVWESIFVPGIQFYISQNSESIGNKARKLVGLICVWLNNDKKIYLLQRP